jgi:uncharacterized protein YkwD
MQMYDAAIIACAAVCVGVLSVCVYPAQVAAAPGPSAEYSKADTDLLASLVNQERGTSSVAPLEMDEELCRVALDHAVDMIARGYFGHSSPHGVTLSTRLRKAGIPFRKASENLAGNASVVLAHRMLMDSPSHKGSILNPEFKKMGLAVVRGGPYGMMIVEIFLTTAEKDAVSISPR